MTGPIPDIYKTRSYIPYCGYNEFHKYVIMGSVVLVILPIQG